MTGSRIQDQSTSFPDKHIKPHISADNSFQVDTRYRTFLGELLYISYFFVIRNFLNAKNDHYKLLNNFVLDSYKNDYINVFCIPEINFDTIISNHFFTSSTK